MKKNEIPQSPKNNINHELELFPGENSSQHIGETPVSFIRFNSSHSSASSPQDMIDVSMNKAKIPIFSLKGLENILSERAGSHIEMRKLTKSLHHSQKAGPFPFSSKRPQISTEKLVNPIRNVQDSLFATETDEAVHFDGLLKLIFSLDSNKTGKAGLRIREFQKAFASALWDKISPPNRKKTIRKKQTALEEMGLPVAVTSTPSDSPTIPSATTTDSFSELNFNVESTSEMPMAFTRERSNHIQMIHVDSGEMKDDSIDALDSLNFSFNSSSIFISRSKGDSSFLVETPRSKRSQVSSRRLKNVFGEDLPQRDFQPSDFPSSDFIQLQAQSNRHEDQSTKPIELDLRRWLEPLEKVLKKENAILQNAIDNPKESHEALSILLQLQRETLELHQNITLSNKSLSLKDNLRLEMMDATSRQHVWMVGDPSRSKLDVFEAIGMEMEKICSFKASELRNVEMKDNVVTLVTKKGFSREFIFSNDEDVSRLKDFFKKFMHPQIRKFLSYNSNIPIPS